MEKKVSFLKNIKKTWFYIKECRGNLIGYVLVSVVEAILSTIIPLVSAKIILSLTNVVIEQLILSALVILIIEIILY